MAYVHCMPARVRDLVHRLDNVVTGVLDTDEGEIAFSTRGHIIKAVNRHYRASAWKPSRGDAVLVDGDRGKDSMTIDHIEADPMVGDGDVCHHPHLEEIGRLIEAKGQHKEIRHWRGGDHARVRFASAASRKDAHGRIHEEIVHATRDEKGEWRVMSTRRADATPAVHGIDQAIAVILARAAGRGLLAGETAMEAERREQDEIKHERLTIAEKPCAVVADMDDCPF